MWPTGPWSVMGKHEKCFSNRLLYWHIWNSLYLRGFLDFWPAIFITVILRLCLHLGLMNTPPVSQFQSFFETIDILSTMCNKITTVIIFHIRFFLVDRSLRGGQRARLPSRRHSAEHLHRRPAGLSQSDGPAARLQVLLQVSTSTTSLPLSPSLASFLQIIRTAVCLCVLQRCEEEAAAGVVLGRLGGSAHHGSHHHTQRAARPHGLWRSALTSLYYCWRQLSDSTLLLPSFERRERFISWGWTLKHRECD